MIQETTIISTPITNTKPRKYVLIFGEGHWEMMELENLNIIG